LEPPRNAGRFIIHAFPTLGRIQIREISAPIVLSALRAIEKRGNGAMARTVRQRMSAVFVYAIALSLAENDPTAVVVNALAPIKRGRQPT
jgi:hypothetical protein